MVLFDFVQRAIVGRTGMRSELRVSLNIKADYITTHELLAISCLMDEADNARNVPLPPSPHDEITPERSRERPLPDEPPLADRSEPVGDEIDAAKDVEGEDTHIDEAEEVEGEDTHPDNTSDLTLRRHKDVFPGETEGTAERAEAVHNDTAKPLPEIAEVQARPPSNGHFANDGLSTGEPSINLTSDLPAASKHKRSLTISKGHIVSVVLISTALDTIAASREAKRSAPLRDSTQKALELIRADQGGDRPREIFEPLRLACETRNEKLMIASLDCISKLISYSFFVEEEVPPPHIPPSPPPSPRHTVRDSAADASHSSIPRPSLVDLVAHTITSCHTENTPETVSLQIVKALLSVVLSPTIIIHHSSLLKAVRTVYNVFLLSTDPVNQMVAQGGLTQMVHHVFGRCRSDRAHLDPTIMSPSTQQDALFARGTIVHPTSEPDALPFEHAEPEVRGTQHESLSSVTSLSMSRNQVEDTTPGEERRSSVNLCVTSALIILEC